MNSSNLIALRPDRIEADDRDLRLIFEDGTFLSIPSEDFPALRSGTLEQRKDWRWIGRRTGIHWPQLDEHLSVHGLLRDYPLHHPHEMADVA